MLWSGKGTGAHIVGIALAFVFLTLAVLSRFHRVIECRLHLLRRLRVLHRHFADIDAGSVAVENFLRPLAIAEFTSDDAVAYAHIRARLERAGTPIGPLDTLIAAQAVARKLTLVSNNEREFRRVSGLNVQNWTR